MKRMEKCDAIIAHMVDAVGRAQASTNPFHHLRLRDVFPAEDYDAMLSALPSPAAYHAMSGRSREARRADGTPTRTKIHLFPEFVRRLPPEQRLVWQPVSRALCSSALREAFMRRLAPGLLRRFGTAYDGMALSVLPMLTRDVAGYGIGVHPDTRHKAITVQIYLPRDRALSRAGTCFHRKSVDGGFERVLQVPMMPNTGYAFAVGSDTYHSLDRLGPEVVARDTILLTYFVDHTLGERIRNRARRFGNAIAHALLP